MKRVIPILVVDSIEACLPFWVDRLGFSVTVEVPHGDRLGFVILARGDVTLEMQTRASVADDVPALAPVAGVATVYIPVEDLAAVQAMLAGYEAVVVPERDTFYGMRETIVRDPGGHFVFFSQPIPTSRPLATTKDETEGVDEV